jgi:hypothetical protein
LFLVVLVLKGPHVIDVGPLGGSITGDRLKETTANQVEECESEAARIRELKLAAARRQRLPQIFAQFGLFGHFAAPRLLSLEPTLGRMGTR